MFNLKTCDSGIPAVDPFPPPPGRHRSGYEKRQHSNKRQDSATNNDGEERLPPTQMAAQILRNFLGSLDPGFQVGLCSSINIVGFISSKAITKKAIVIRYNTTHNIA